ncbi:uncharacterized protein LOC107636648 [Arachis ipaensis]|uniref:uncharacterized protein LOC107636648 n=1 Tax=Arachis ipaensis TaxID=130454 RepID=UPI0007AF4550|nr:uncharacterized protein LOC107636648 [Arachis ipaensis]XP_025647771.1 uncharacterized protein LOC112742757 [Arachis hypogaea]
MNTLAPQQDSSKSKCLRLNPEQMEVCHLVRDLGIRPMIWKFHPSKRDEIRRAYLKAGPNQPILDNYPFSSDTSRHRRFQASWFELYPSWLEYSIEDDAVYYLPCYLFAIESSINTGSNAFIENDFRNWKKLILMVASTEVRQIHEFFTQLTAIVSIVGTSCKRYDQLQEAQEIENAKLIANDELEIGQATHTVLNNIIDGTTSAKKCEAYGVNKGLLIFCAKHYNKIPRHFECIHVVSTSKLLLKKLRDNGWCNLLEIVKKFCEKHEIDIPDMSTQYTIGRGRSCQPKITIKHHYRVDVFLAAIASQIQELNSRFNEETMELLTLSIALDLKDNFKLFNIQNICKLAEKFYPSDFSDYERILLNAQLQHYAFDILNHLKDVGTLSELCKRLKETGKLKTYHLVDRLICNVLTLPVSTATTERAFSAMKIFKTRLQSKMADEFLVDNLVICIEKEIAATFSTNSIIDDFESRKKR